MIGYFGLIEYRYLPLVWISLLAKDTRLFIVFDNCWPLAYGRGDHCAMALPSDPKNKKV